MHPLIRRLVFGVLPAGAIRTLRRWHAPRVAARFTDADWPYAEFVRSVVKPGDTVIDVGANMGYITARLADYVGPQGKVIAVEPIPDTFASLESTVSKLGLRQVQPIHACVSSQPGRVEMEIPADDAGAENLYESSIIDPAQPAQGRRVTVPALTLNTLLKTTDEARRTKHDERSTTNEARISFIKIDVEGHELAVVQGADELLQAQRPVLLIEVAGNPDEPDAIAAQLFRELDRWGYRPFHLVGDRLQPRQTGDQAVDYWFIAEGAS